METLRNRNISNSKDTPAPTESHSQIHDKEHGDSVTPTSSKDIEKSKVEDHSAEVDVEKAGAIRSASVYAEEEGPVEGDGDNNPELKDIPWSVRRVVSLHDDPTLPTITFRYFLLTILFVAPGAFLSQLSSFRTTASPYSIFFVQVASNYVGLWLAKILPAKVVRVPFTRFSFSLNPGPWSVKEHVLVTISAASGATGNLGVTPLAMSELYYNNPVHPAAAIFFMLAIVWVGYSYAAIARQFLLYEPTYPWFTALCQSALFETQHKQIKTPSKLASRQMKVFFWVLLGVTLWQFLPEYAFPFLSSLAFLCWVAPSNPTANFLGSGLGGMGFLNFSLDWANISNYNSGVPIFLSPFWTQVVLFASFVVSCWILLPAAKWGYLGSSPPEALMSNRMFLGMSVSAQYMTRG